jgi:hypothetical protein
MALSPFPSGEMDGEHPVLFWEDHTEVGAASLRSDERSRSPDWGDHDPGLSDHDDRNAH